MIATLFGLAAPTAAHAVRIAGYPDRIGVPQEDRLMIRTPDTDVLVRLTGLSARQRATLEAALSNRSSVRLDLPASAILSITRVPGGVRPDCTELPISYDELTSRARQGGPEGFLNFLGAIPRGTLQTFVLAYGSDSNQREGVSRQTPRVIRSTTDGSIMMAYNCNPNAPTYGTVEMIRREGNRLRFSQIDFRRSPPAVTEDPPQCRSCHQAMTLDENGAFRALPDSATGLSVYRWDNYPHWRHFYGANGGELTELALPATHSYWVGASSLRHSPDLEDFQRFRATEARTNPCYTSLPWARPPFPNTMDHYPYYRQRNPTPQHEFADRTVSRFPAFRIGAAISENMARVFQARIEEHPDFVRIEPLLAYALSCSQQPRAQENWARLRALVPGLPAGPPTWRSEIDLTRAPVVQRILEHLGIPRGAWELNASEMDGSRFPYNDGLYNLSSRYFSVFGERFLERYGEGYGRLFPQVNGVERLYTPPLYSDRDFCILPGLGPSIARRRLVPLGFELSSPCEQLFAAGSPGSSTALATLAGGRLACPPPNPFEEITAFVRTLEPVVRRPSGDELFNQCLSCHGQTFRNRFAETAFLTEAVNSVRGGRMPPGNALPEVDRDTLIEYLRSSTHSGP